MTPERALRELPELSGAKLARCLADGPVSSTWSVAREQERFVLTVDKPVAAAMGLDRPREFAILRQLHGQDIAPPAVAAAPGALVVAEMPGAPVSAFTGDDGGTIKRLGVLLARLHGLGLAAPELDLADAVHRYADLADDCAAMPLRDAALERLSSLPSSGEVCFCHVDIHRENLLQLPDGSLRLVDWEYAALVDPLFEFGVLARESELGRAELEELLAAYRSAGGRGTIDPGSIDPWQGFYNLLRRLWVQATGAWRRGH